MTYISFHTLSGAALTRSGLMGLTCLRYEVATFGTQFYQGVEAGQR